MRLQVFCNDEWIAAVATAPSQVTVREYNIVIASAGRSNPYMRLQLFYNDKWTAAVACAPSQ